MFKKPMLFVVVSILLGCNTTKAEFQTPAADWLFDKYIDVTYNAALNPSYSESDREEAGVHFYQFAFDYWLVSRTNQIVAPFQWRASIRQLFHRLNNAKRFSDPAAIAPFFSADGKVHLPPLRANLPGIDGDTFTFAQYQDLVRRFDLAFADFYSVFPPDHPPTNGSVFVSPKVEEEVGPSARFEFQRARWSAVHLEVLGPHKFIDANGDEKYEHEYRDTPPEVFLVLTPKAQAYYLPAFLLFSERNPTRSRDILPVLLKKLTERSKDAEILRGELTPTQKELIVGYYENWCIHEIASSKIKKLRHILTGG